MSCLPFTHFLIHISLCFLVYLLHRCSPLWEMSGCALRAVTSSRLCILVRPWFPATGWQPGRSLQHNLNSWKSSVHMPSHAGGWWLFKEAMSFNVLRWLFESDLCRFCKSIWCAFSCFSSLFINFISPLWFVRPCVFRIAQVISLVFQFAFPECMSWNFLTQDKVRLTHAVLFEYFRYSSTCCTWLESARITLRLPLGCHFKKFDLQFVLKKASISRVRADGEPFCFRAKTKWAPPGAHSGNSDVLTVAGVHYYCGIKNYQYFLPQKYRNWARFIFRFYVFFVFWQLNYI